MLMCFVFPFAFPQKRVEKLELLSRVGRDGPLGISRVFSWCVWENLPTPILCLILLLLFLFLSFHTRVHTYTRTHAYIHTSAWSHVSRTKWFHLMIIYQCPACSIYPSIYLTSPLLNRRHASFFSWSSLNLTCSRVFSLFQLVREWALITLNIFISLTSFAMVPREKIF